MKFSLYNYIIFLVGVIAVIILVNLNPKSPIDWRETFNPNDKIPYGTYILNQEIDSFFDKPIERISSTAYEYIDTLKDSTQSYNFLFLSDNIIDETSINKTLKWVENGSIAFFVDNYFLQDTLNIESDFLYINASENPELKLNTLSAASEKFLYPELEKSNGIYFFKHLDIKRDISLGHINVYDKKYINFVEIPFGKGKIYILLTPKIFTNIYLKDYPDIRKYASLVLGYLPKENKTIWFNYSFDTNHHSNDILTIILNNESLVIAWRLFLLGIILYLIFQGKRRQRIIPLIEKPKNTTIEFAQTIGNLYFQEGEPYTLAQKKIVYFLDNIRKKYYIDIQNLDEEFAQKLALKSGRDKELTSQLIKLIFNIQQMQSASEETLKSLDKLIEKFWNNNV